MHMDRELILRHAQPVPRYTSYPTAPHFTSVIQAPQYAHWLSVLPEGARLSLYVHIPFCQSLCWYCACTTKALARYEPVQGYLASLEQEIANVAARLPKQHRVTHIHWGGGSPNFVAAADMRRLSDTMRERLGVARDAEFAVEIDPRTLEEDQIAALVASGVNRVSIGVQDFDAAVQSAINRVQSYDTTKRAVDAFRGAGVASINIDLVYGLPHQTRVSLARTVEQVLTLRPDRIAIFGYAHLPERMTHQRLIDGHALPGVVERFAQSQRVARILAGAGYVQIGLDHFALPTDSLAQGGVKRNFQGYTTDTADALLGLGASAIGRLPQGYVQNAVPTGEYLARMRDIGLATVRGVMLSEEDRLRGCVIEGLMCNFALSKSALERRFGNLAQTILDEAETLLEADRDGFLARTADGFDVTQRGRPFVRTLCACFDAYLGKGRAQHALAV
jgi:oxygen-independent coproporphyrinogen-3 oxidase